ncbi:hypothetical protein [Burkholderia territorii]|uniref:hypothetical protein n=1 Tax=Burkholderia territorii TaxID=1503055 RepID=UPI0009C164DE|nr:hypothetical protein [Burkholderia territorii]
MSDFDTPARRRELLYRRANGKKIFSSYLKKVAALAPSAGQADLISLESTETLLVKFNACRLALHELKRRISPSGIRLVLSNISKTYRDGAYVLIDEDWMYCGALRIAEPHIINRTFRFGREIANDLVFISCGMKKAISLDYFEMNGSALIDVVEWR